METHQRTLTRAISWRIVATVTTAFWTGLSGAIIINAFMTLMHYAHERVWLNISWGKS